MKEEDIYAVPVPKKTKSYSPISHKYIVTNIKKQLQENNTRSSYKH